VVRTQAWRNQRERRFHLDAARLPALVRALEAELPSVSYVDGTDRSLVVTTYLDSAGQGLEVLARAAGGRRSIKVRVREYIALFPRPDGARLVPAGLCYLERKERLGQIRVKQRIELPKSDVSRVLRRELTLPVDDAVAAALRAEIETRTLEPVLVTGYRRRVFGRDGALRVTLDEGIAFFPAPGDLYRSAGALTPEVLGQPIGQGPDYVLEVKEPDSETTPAWLERALEPLDQADQFSKFREGVRCLAQAAAPQARASGD
jgi:hypothetical protein